MQRIQSLFLLLVIALSFPAAIATLTDINTPTMEFIRISAFRSNNFRTGAAHWSNYHFIAPTLLLVGALISAYAISLFKKRKLQMKLCILNIGLQILTITLFALELKPYFENHSLIRYYAPITFPLVSVVLLWLAYRGIKSDEDKIKSIDRIR